MNQPMKLKQWSKKCKDKTREPGFIVKMVGRTDMEQWSLQSMHNVTTIPVITVYLGLFSCVTKFSKMCSSKKSEN